MARDDVMTDPTAPTAAGMLDRFNALLDLATDRFIEENPSHKVFDENLEPYQFMLTNALVTSASSAPVLRRELIGTGEAVEYATGLFVIDADSTGTYGEMKWYKRGAPAWRSIRAIEFEHMIPLVQTIASFDGSRFDGSIERARMMREGLTPAVDFADKVGELTTGITSTSEVRDTIDDLNQRWNTLEGAVSALTGWEGNAAKVFKGACLQRLPSILAGQTMTAKLLEDALVLTRSAYTNLGVETELLIQDGAGVLTAYPVATDHALDWGKIFAAVAGVAGIVSASASPLTATITIGQAGAVISGLAALASLITGKPAVAESQAAPPGVTGATVTEIMTNLHRTLERYLAVVGNTERTLARELTAWQEYVVAPGDTATSIAVNDAKEDVSINRRNSFFCVKDVHVANLADEPLSVVDDSENFGAAPSSGRYLGARLEALESTGSIRLPELADTLDSLAGSAADEGLNLAFSRTAFGSAPGLTHDYTTTETGELYPAWMGLYVTLTQDLIGESAENLRDAGKALVSIAYAYASVDEAAAAELASYGNDLEGM